jgi:hypothetical protein
VADSGPATIPAYSICQIPVAALFAGLVSMPPAERLAALHRVEPAVRAATQATVEELRAGGATWAEIGRLIGVTRQTAQIRWGRGQG